MGSGSRVLVVLLGVIALMAAAGCVRSIRPTAPPRNGVIRPGPGAADPIVATGIATGDYSLGDGPEAGSGCVGYVTLEPSFLIEMPFDAAFIRVFTESDQDTTLAIRTPQGTFMCDDNTNGWNASIEGRFRSGVYPVWVGTRHQNLSPAYRLAVTARAEVTNLAGAGAGAPMQPPGAVTQ
jgi:hypothetical protein